MCVLENGSVLCSLCSGKHFLTTATVLKARYQERHIVLYCIIQHTVKIHDDYIILICIHFMHNFYFQMFLWQLCSSHKAVIVFLVKCFQLSVSSDSRMCIVEGTFPTGRDLCKYTQLWCAWSTLRIVVKINNINKKYNLVLGLEQINYISINFNEKHYHNLWLQRGPQNQLSSWLDLPLLGSIESVQIALNYWVSNKSINTS